MATMSVAHSGVENQHDIHLKARIHQIFQVHSSGHHQDMVSMSLHHHHSFRKDDQVYILCALGQKLKVLRILDHRDAKTLLHHI